MTIILGVFLALHGLVHLLYAGQSVRFFELHPNMTWPDGARLFSRSCGARMTHLLAAVLLALAALGFIDGGLGLSLQQEWWRWPVLGAALFSAAAFLLFWDGRLQALADQGCVGLLINLAIVIVVLLGKWP
jgi:uncharacterized membrane protein (DUF2068 family)